MIELSAADQAAVDEFKKKYLENPDKAISEVFAQIAAMRSERNDRIDRELFIREMEEKAKQEEKELAEAETEIER